MCICLLLHHFLLHWISGCTSPRAPHPLPAHGHVPNPAGCPQRLYLSQSFKDAVHISPVIVHICKASPSFLHHLQPVPTSLSAAISQQTPSALRVPLPMPWQRVQDCLYQPIPAPTPAPFTATNSLSWAQHTLKDNFSSREARRCLPPEPRSGNNA